MTSQDAFNRDLSTWLEYGRQPWGELRYTVLNFNLARHLSQKPLKILDAGGGSGRDAIRLAQQGHVVTLLDYSEAMLEEAQKDADNAGVSQKIHCQLGKIEEISTLFPAPEFDLVLFHNVIQYVENPADAIRAVCTPLRSQGFLSLSSINRYSEAYRQAIIRLDPAEALESLDQHEMYTETFNTTTTIYAADELIPLVEQMHCEIVGHYGIRCVNDYILDNQQKYDPAFYEQLQNLEIAMSDRYPYYLLARIFQIVARKL